MAFFFGMAWLALLRHAHLQTGEDLAMFDQMLWNFREGCGLVSTISGNEYLLFQHHFFGEHVSPILYLLAWPAGLTSGPEALLVMQVLALALAAFPLWRLTIALTGSPRLGVCVALGWLLQPALWGAALYDFHMEALEGLFLFSFALAFRKGRWQAVFWAVLYASCKEDAPIYLTAIALLAGWRFKQLRLGALIAAGAFVYVLWAVLWLGPAFSPTSKHLLSSRLFTPAVCGGLWPWIQEVLLNQGRWNALGHHLLALGLLPLIGGRLVIPAAMAVGLMWLSTENAQAVMFMHYPLTVYPLLFLGALGGLTRLLPSDVLAARLVLRRWGWVGVTVLTLVGLLFMGRVRIRDCREFGISCAPSVAESCRAARATLAKIPGGDDDWLAVLPSLAAHVARHKNLTVTLKPRDADWLVLRLDDLIYPIHPGRYHEWLQALLATNSAYGVEAVGGNRVVILRHGYSKVLNEGVRHLPRELAAEDLFRHLGRPAADPASLNGRVVYAGPSHRHGIMAFGPYLNLEAGQYRFGFHVKADRLNPADSVVLSVTARGGGNVLAERKLDRATKGYEWVELASAVTVASTNLEFRCFKRGGGSVHLDVVNWQRVD